MAETVIRNARKVRTGEVISISGDKTITVQITYRKHHPKYCLPPIHGRSSYAGSLAYRPLTQSGQADSAQ